MVTLWGQSAGAVSVALHMASVKSAGLFNKVNFQPIILTYISPILHICNHAVYTD